MEIKIKDSTYKLVYPCEWLYKVIGSDKEQLRQAITHVIKDSSCSITPSNSSKTGKYHCLNLEITVQNEEERNLIYEALKEHPQVKLVL
jgi:putative lipoic acid-binding regulatory protein